MPRKIIIDTDPGQDDAVAILLALASPELEVLGVTAVAGNVPLELTWKNARKVVELAGRDVPVLAGADRPLRRALRTEPPGTVTLCPLGPLTNVAAALERAPDIAARIERIVLMGGAYFEVGNITPAAEFNIFVDPEAAAAVFACRAPITVVPLDCTHKALTTAARNAAFRAAGRVGPVVAGWTGFFERFDREKYGSEGAPLHDPCVIAWLLEPGLFSGREVNVEIETDSELTRGMTVADWWGVTDRPPNALFLRHVDADGFFDLVTERLSRL
jgi:purine nucleosidase